MRDTTQLPWLVKGDLDGFFGLMIDNLVQVLVIISLCTTVCGLPESLVFGTVLPAVAVSLLVGNLYYAWHARNVAARDNNPTCTALPYGINTVSMLAYIFFIMAPVYQQYRTTIGDEQAGILAWKVGMLACVVSAVLELGGAVFGSWIRKVTPRAALLAPLAAVAVIFIAGNFAFQIYDRPILAIPPLFIVLINYFSRLRFPLGLPGGFVAIIAGTVLAWSSGLWGPAAMSGEDLLQAGRMANLSLPRFCGGELLDALRGRFLLRFLSVTVPMGLLNMLGSLQNIESAASAGDRFDTRKCLLVNGLGSLVAAGLGSCFPTTIYIGHPGWKALGARWGYSVINGVFFAVVFFAGLGAVLHRLIPLEAGIGILLWIAVVICAQSYQAVRARHYPAVAMGFFPAVAAMAVMFGQQYLTSGQAAVSLAQILSHPQHGWFPVGMYALAGANSGFLVTSMIIAAVCVYLIDRQFTRAGLWLLVGAATTVIGLQHAYRVQGNTVRELLIWQVGPFGRDVFVHRAWGIAAAYGITAAAMLVLAIWANRSDASGQVDANSNC